MSTLPEIIPHAKTFNKKLHNTRVFSTGAQKNITQNFTIPEWIQHTEKYNTRLQNTTACPSHRKLYYKIPQQHSALHTQKI